MIDYGKWRETQILATSLLLDPRNPRIPSGHNLSQRALVAELVENDDVLDLAKSIADNGYYPVESLIVVEEGGKKYVVEGNRRLAALKLLLSPEAAPVDWVRRFRTLSIRIDPSSIKKVKIILAPSREEAAPVIMSKHTRKQVESWTPVMQDKFYQNLFDQGLTVSEISAQYKVQPGEITDSLRRYMMYSIACELDLPEDILKKVQNPRQFPVTTLERLYKAPQVSQFLGIAFDENKRLTGSVQPEEFRKGYAKIVSDIARGDVDSRTLNTTDKMKKYLGAFGTDKPNLQNVGAFTEDVFLSGQEPGTRPEKKTPTTRKPQKTKPVATALIPPAFLCDVNNQRINDIFKELQELHVAKFPNATGLMFRSLLEMSLGYYLDRTGHLATIVEAARSSRAKKNQNLPKGWHPTLQEMLVYVTSKEADVIQNGNILRAIEKLVEQKNDLISIDSLNLFVHNQHIHPTTDTLRTFWLQLQGLFEILLVEPEPSGKN